MCIYVCVEYNMWSHSWHDAVKPCPSVCLFAVAVNWAGCADKTVHMTHFQSGSFLIALLPDDLPNYKRQAIKQQLDDHVGAELETSRVYCTGDAALQNRGRIVLLYRDMLLSLWLRNNIEHPPPMRSSGGVGVVPSVTDRQVGPEPAGLQVVGQGERHVVLRNLDGRALVGVLDGRGTRSMVYVIQHDIT